MDDRISRERMTIQPLADHPIAIPILAKWFFHEWRQFDGRALPQIERQLRENLRHALIPITFLALRNAELIGTVSLDLSDLPPHDHLSPWLASLYVTPACRHRGVGRALVEHLMAFARAKQVPIIFLWTPGSTAPTGSAHRCRLEPEHRMSTLHRGRPR